MKIVIVCALGVEASAARRAVGGAADVVCCGPGSEAAERAARRGGEMGAGAAVLFGTCGGLAEVEVCPSVVEVVDESGGRWVPTIGTRGAGGVRLLSVRSVLTSVEAKRRARELSGAVVVDCESAGFARGCVTAGLAWGVVRGVSDAWDRALPEGVSGWVGADGATRAGRVVASCVVSPGLIPRVWRLGVDARAALRAAGERLKGVLEELEREVVS